MKVVIFCGGENLRFRSELIAGNKVMAKIESKPVVWHIMKQYAKYGFVDFILCLRDDDIEISNYFSRRRENWRIQLLKTGNDSETGERLYRARRFLKEGTFMVTYGDGVANINIAKLLEFHLNSLKVATLTAVRSRHQYGILKINSDNEITRFTEKAVITDWINGGFFVFNEDVFTLLQDDLGSLEHGLLKRLVQGTNLVSFKHHGYWKSVDTYKDLLELRKDYQSKRF